MKSLVLRSDGSLTQRSKEWKQYFCLCGCIRQSRTMHCNRCTSLCIDNNGVQSFIERVKFFIRKTTVEPVMLVVTMAFALQSITNQNLMLQKACHVNLDFSEEACDAVASGRTEDFRLEEGESQKIVANINIWKAVIENSFPVFYVLFMGSWSDRHGRKPLMVLCLCGLIVMTLGATLSVFFWDWPAEVSAILEAVPHSVTGGRVALTMSMFSYIADISSYETRTVRMGVATSFFMVGFPIGFALSGFLYQSFGFYGIFSTSFLLYCGSLIYIIRRVREKQESCLVHKKKSCTDNCDVNHPVDSLKTVIKPRSGSIRLQLLLMIAVTFFIHAPFHGRFTYSILSIYSRLL